MRVIVVTEWYPSASSPIAGVFVQRDTALLAEHHDVELVHLVDAGVITDADRAADAASPFRVTRVDRAVVPVGRRSPWLTLGPLLDGADLLHTHALRTLVSFAGHRVSVPWVHSEHWSGLHDPSTLPLRGRLMMRLIATQLQRPDVVTAVGTTLADRVRRFRSGPIELVPSVVEPAAVRQPTPTDVLRLIGIGNVNEHKGAMIAVEAVRLLRAAGTPTELTWAGDGPLRAALESAARELGGIRVLGNVSRERVSAELDAADVFVLPTRSETLGLSALEAIRHGRPAVIGAMGGMRDYITAANGRLVDERTPEAFAAAIGEAAADPRLRNADAVASTISDRYTPQSVLAGYTRAFERASRPTAP